MRRQFIALGIVAAILVVNLPAMPVAIAGGPPYEMFRLTPPNGSTSTFGRSVSLDGSRVAVGDHYENVVHLFERSGSNWIHAQEVRAPNVQPYGLFGGSVALAGNTLAVGSLGASDYAGAVYIFAQEGPTWVLRQTLTAPDATSHGYFATSLAIDENRLLIGAYHGGNGPDPRGTAYLYRHSEGSWVLEQEFFAPPQDDVGFGWNVALDGEQLLVVACGWDTAYLYTYSDSGWFQSARIPGDGPGLCGGRRYALEGSTLFVGRPRRTVENHEKAGVVDVYQRIGADWSLTTTLLPPTIEAHANFGHSVDVTDGRLIVGAPDGTGLAPETQHGEVFLFEGHGASWTFREKFMAPRSDWNSDTTSDWFGAQIDIIPGGSFVVASYRVTYIFLKPPAVPPAAPSELRATSNAAGVQLFWHAPIDDGGASVVTYRVYRATSDAGPFDRVGKVPGGTTTFTDTGASAGSWSYRVSAENQAGEGPPSTVASAISRAPPKGAPGVPLRLIAAWGPSAGSVGLTWHAPQRGAIDPPIDHYNVYRLPSPEDVPLGFPMAVVPAGAIGEPLHFHDSTTAAGQRYFYDVSASSATAEGPRTDSVDIRPGITLFYLMHGICSDSSMWLTESGGGHGIYRRLLKVPNSIVAAADYAPQPGASPSQVIHLQAMALRDTVEENAGVERVVIVGHSMGGLIARGMSHEEAIIGIPISRIITIDSPDRGADLAWWQEAAIDTICSEAWAEFDDNFLWRNGDAPPAWMNDLASDQRITRMLFGQCIDRVQSPIRVPGTPAKCTDAFDSAALREDFAEWSGAVVLSWSEAIRERDSVWQRGAHTSACTGGDRRDGTHPTPFASVLGFDADPLISQPPFPFHNKGPFHFAAYIANVIATAQVTTIPPGADVDVILCGSTQAV